MHISMAISYRQSTTIQLSTTHQRGKISVPSEIVKHMTDKTDIGRYRDVDEGAPYNRLNARPRICRAVSARELAPNWCRYATAPSTFHGDTDTRGVSRADSAADIPLYSLYRTDTDSPKEAYRRHFVVQSFEQRPTRKCADNRPRRSAIDKSRSDNNDRARSLGRGIAGVYVSSVTLREVAALLSPSTLPGERKALPYTRLG